MQNLENVKVSIRKTPDGEHYAVGTEIEGLFFPFQFASFPAGYFEQAIEQAKEQNAKKAKPASK